MAFAKNPSFLFLILFSIYAKAQAPEGIKVAFLADVHLQDLYAIPEDSDYRGLINPKNGKPTLLRTMEAQIHSTRIFNENYFAFIAALEDIASRGIHYVALPGDYSDDGQPMHIRGLHHILEQYSKKHSIEFFITTGNHDPVGPFGQDAGKNDFLGTGGKRQPLFSKEGMYEPKSENELPVVITPDIAVMGYEGIASHLKQYGFFPKENYTYWATPFSSYTVENYDYAKAIPEAAIANRTYETAPGYTVPDMSYIVEPVDGLWLLAIDGNIYVPKATSNGDAKNPKNYAGADLGYNNLFSHKKHLVAWVKRMADEAKKHSKTLIAFSHYPMVEFNDDASEDIEALMGSGKWQLNRVPKEEVAQAFADAGLVLHFGGHMHINDTGIRKTKSGNTLVNVQTPSLAAYIPAYKLLTIKPNAIAEIETIAIDKVPDFDLLFDLYRIEHKYLESIHATPIWDDAILRTKSYHEFTDWHLAELVRLRFLPDDWPAAFREFLFNRTGDELLVLANSPVSIDSLIKDKSKFKKEWKMAKTETAVELSKANLEIKDFEQWKGLDFITDFYRIRSADRLAIIDIGKERIKQYQLLSKCFFENHGTINSPDSLEKSMGLFLTIFGKFLNGAPADHFSVDLKTGEVQEIEK